MFGKVASGMEFIDALESIKTTKVIKAFKQYRDVPREPIVIEDAYIQ